MVITSERARPTLDPRDGKPSDALPLRSSPGSSSGGSNGTASGLEPALAGSLLSVGKAATAQLRPALSVSLASRPVISGAVSPTVAAIGFWVSGGTAAYVKYGPHGKELDPLLKTVMVVATVFGLLTTSVLLWFTCNRDRALKRTFRQENAAAFGGMAGLVCTLLARTPLGDMFMTVLIPESLGMMNNLVPESYPIEMLSGLLVSSCRLGMVLGILLAYPLTAGLWNQRRLKWVMVACSAVFVATLVALAAACYDWKTPTEFPAKAQTQRLVFILSCQFVAGIAQGIVMTGARLMLARVTPPSSQVTMAIMHTVLACCGYGFGPVLSNAVRQGLRSVDTVAYPGEVCGVCVLVLAALSALWLAAFYLFVPWSNEGAPVPLGAVRGPSSQANLGDFPKDAEPFEEVAQNEAAQKKLFVTYLAVQAERAWLVAGLEVVTAMVMEQEFEISQRDIGFAVGSCFMIATPLIVIGAYAKQVMHPTTLLVGLGVAMPCLCLLIFHFPAEFLHVRGTAGLALLLSADTLIYPVAMLLGGIIEGLALGYAIIPGSRTYSSAVAVIGRELVSGVARFIAMPISRLIVASGGRDSYAAVQFGLSCLSLLSCILVLPAVRLLVPTSSSSNSSSRAPSRQPSFSKS